MRSRRELAEWMQYDEYCYPSMEFYDRFKADALRVLQNNQELLKDSSRGEEALSFIQEWIANTHKFLRRIDGLKADGYFVPKEWCDGKEYWIDWKSFHEDKGDAEFETVRDLKSMYKFKGTDIWTDEKEQALEQAIDKHTRFAFAHFKKAGGIGWRLQAQIRQRMIEGENNE